LVVSSRKGGALPLIIVIGLVFLLLLLLSFALGNKLLSDINVMVQEDDSFTGESKAVMAKVASKNALVLDNAFAFLYAGLLIGALISGFTTDRTPVFLLLTIILLFATGYVGAKISNFYDDFQSDDSELSLANDFPKAHFIMSKLPIFIVGLVFVFGIGVLMRNQGIF
jgi:hypothetical protein